MLVFFQGGGNLNNIKKGKNRDLGLLGAIKKKGCIVCVIMNGKD